MGELLTQDWLNWMLIIAIVTIMIVNHIRSKTFKVRGETIDIIINEAVERGKEIRILSAYNDLLNNEISKIRGDIKTLARERDVIWQSIER